MFDWLKLPRGFSIKLGFLSKETHSSWANTLELYVAQDHSKGWGGGEASHPVGSEGERSGKQTISGPSGTELSTSPSPVDRPHARALRPPDERDPRLTVLPTPRHLTLGAKFQKTSSQASHGCPTVVLAPIISCYISFLHCHEENCDGYEK